MVETRRAGLRTPAPRAGSAGLPARPCATACRANSTASGDRGQAADPVEQVIASGEGRIADLIPIRHGRMMVSPFTFYRGAADIMAADLADTPVSGITAQICGDCHLLNLGAFATPERRVIVDINDFDETLPGPWEWDRQAPGGELRSGRAFEQLRRTPISVTRRCPACGPIASTWRSSPRCARSTSGTRAST